MNIGDDYIKIDDAIQSDEALSPSIKKIREKGFTYIEVAQDYMIFWEDETGYYGVLWSDKPTEAISRIREDFRPHMKSRKLSKEWYEVGALDSIKNIITTSISDQESSYTIAELENYFNDDSVI